MAYSRQDIKNIVDIVLRELEESRPPRKVSDRRILAVLSGGKAGVGEALSQLRILARDGCGLYAVLTPNARNMLEDDLKASLPGIDILSDGQLPDVALESLDMAIIPALTHNTVAKLAHGIADNWATTLLMRVLLAEIPVLAVDDACDLKAGAESGKMSPYRRRLLENQETLKTFGVLMTKAVKLADTVNSFFNRRSALKAGTSPDRVISKGVLSKADVEQCQGNCIYAAPKAVITPAAAERARELGINILRR